MKVQSNSASASLACVPTLSPLHVGCTQPWAMQRLRPQDSGERAGKGTGSVVHEAREDKKEPEQGKALSGASSS